MRSSLQDGQLISRLAPSDSVCMRCLLLYPPQRLKAKELALIGVLPVFLVGGNGQEGHDLHSDINLQGWPHQLLW
jgi:hypothetical protein